VAKRERPDPPEPLEPAVGAVIFASDEPVTAKQISRSLSAEVGAVEEAIGKLERKLERNGLGLLIEHVAGGVRFATRPEVGSWVRQFFRERNRTRLSLPALETLAIVAYRQPMTAPEIQAIRGKDPGAAIKGLLDKKLIRCLGRKKVLGSPLLYGTTKEFLLHFALDSLEDLPSIEDFDQFLDVVQAQGQIEIEEAETETVAPLAEPPAGAAAAPPPDAPPDV